MRFAPLAFIFLAGCATQVSVSLPLHKEKIPVPRTVGHQYAATYVEGYEAGWLSTLRIFAENIDHKRTFSEDVSIGDPNYLSGWFAARDEAEAFVQRLISDLGRDRARAKLAEALPLKKEPNQTLEPTTTAVTNRAGARFAPAAVVAHL
jgi:hypothetical protein